MKENFINILREATENNTPNNYYTKPNETPSQNKNQSETNYQYQPEPLKTGQNTYYKPQQKLEPINTVIPTLEPDATSENNYNIPTGNKSSDQFLPKNKQNQFIDASPVSSINCEQVLSVWRALFPTIPAGINLLSSYTPQVCKNKEYNFNFTITLSDQKIARLIREIYLRILLSLDTYSLLIRKEALTNQKELAALRTQMQVMSGAMLNVYQDYTGTNVVPLRNSINSCLPQNLKDAYCYLHDEIFYIYFLLSKLIYNLKNNTSFYGQLVTVLNNIKYQLYILSTYYNNINKIQ